MARAKSPCPTIPRATMPVLTAAAGLHLLNLFFRSFYAIKLRVGSQRNASTPIGRMPRRKGDLMLEGPFVFVDIDTQRDFLEPAGALYVPGSADIIPNLAPLSQFAQRHHVHVIATACAHRLDDPELTRYPPHCLAGTPGQERIAATANLGSVVLGLDDRLGGELPPHVTLLKREIDVFSRPDADDVIARYDRNQPPPLFVVYGVYADYCIRAAVEGLLRANAAWRSSPTPPEPSTRRPNPACSPTFKRGVILTVTEVVCNGWPSNSAMTSRGSRFSFTQAAAGVSTRDQTPSACPRAH